MMIYCKHDRILPLGTCLGLFDRQQQLLPLSNLNETGYDTLKYFHEPTTANKHADFEVIPGNFVWGRGGTRNFPFTPEISV